MANKTSKTTTKTNNPKDNGKKIGQRGKGKGFNPRRGQPRKDSDSKRVDFDNTRVDKFDKDVGKDVEQGSKDESRNDISDFNRNPELLKAAASIPFASITGDALTDGTGYTVPGVLTLVYNPCFGTEQYPQAWNRAYQQIYSYVVHANSRNYAQDYPDYALFMQAGQEVFAAISDAVRAYGVMKSYTEPNFYLVEGLLLAMGWDPYDLRKNLSQMWFDINDMILNTKDIWVPNVMPLLNRMINLNSYVYTDAPGERSQMYVYVRDHYYALSGTGSEHGTSLVPAYYTTYDSEGTPTYTTFERCSMVSSAGSATVLSDDLTVHTWEEFRSMVYNMIERLQAQQDRGMIYGNLMNAYGSEKIFALSPIDVNYQVKPVYNAEILMQIENITTCEDKWPRVFSQYQNANDNPDLGPQLVTQWYSYVDGDDDPVSGAGPTDKVLLNMHIAEQPSPEAIVEATRMQCVGTVWAPGFKDSSTFDTKTGLWTVAGSPGYIYRPYTCGSELVRGIFYSYNTMFSQSGAPIKPVVETVRLRQYQSFAFRPVGSTVGVSRVIDWLELMAFDWHPFMYNYTVNPGTPSLGEYKTNFVYAFGDFDNYTVLNAYEHKKLDDMCFYSLFGLPQSGYNHKYLD